MPLFHEYIALRATTYSIVVVLYVFVRKSIIYVWIKELKENIMVIIFTGKKLKQFIDGRVQAAGVANLEPPCGGWHSGLCWTVTVESL